MNLVSVYTLHLIAQCTINMTPHASTQYLIYYNMAHIDLLYMTLLNSAQYDRLVGKTHT